MKLRQKLFRLLAGLTTNRPGTVLVVCAALTFILLIAAGRLGMRTQFAEMMPQDIPAVKEYMDIIDDYSSDATVMITLENPSKDMNLLCSAADDLAARLNGITLIRPTDGTSLSFSQKMAVSKGKIPDGIPCDTIDLVRRIDYKVDTDFAAEHGLIIQKPKDLENTLEMFSSLALPDLIGNINDNFEKEFIDDADNINTLDGEAQAVQGLEGIRRFLSSMGLFMGDKNETAARKAVKEFILGQGYFVSPDNTMLLMMVQPSVSFDEFDDLMYLGYRIDDTLSVVEAENPGVTIGRTGAMMMQIDENNAFAKDFSWPTVIALILILILLIGSFRTWKNPFLSVTTLIIGIIWTTGILAVTLHYLNMMSAGFGIVLLGLGIDFGIHLISGFRDGREQGLSVKDAIFFMYERVGAGVVTGALTTAIVFYSLQLTNLEAYGQMGIAMGTGIIVILVSQMVMLPALIVWDNKGYSIIGNILRRLRLGFIVNIWNAIGRLIGAFFRIPVFSWICSAFQFGFLEPIGRFLTRLPVAVSVISVSTVLVAISINAGSKMEWEYDMMKLQPQGTPSQITQKNIIDKYEISPDFALVKAENIEDCRELVEGFKKVGNRTGLVGSVDAITEFIPTDSIQRLNALSIENFRTALAAKPEPEVLGYPGMSKLLNELKRLHQNIVEIGELSIMSHGDNNKIINKCDQIVGKDDAGSAILKLADKILITVGARQSMTAYQAVAFDVLKSNLQKMANTEIVTLDNLPETIRNRYVNPKNDDLLINVYPKGNIWEKRILHNFNEQTAKVTPRITGLPAIVELLLQLMQDKGRLAIGFGLAAIALFLLLDFRSLNYTFLAMLSLAVGGTWMLGLMAAAGMKLSMMSFMGLPLIVGIGIDDGVHMLHRYHIEGPGKIPQMLRYTGRAILLTSLTTMIGFGSMGLASHPGIAALGATLFFGVGACFLSSAFVLPSLLSIKEALFYRRHKLRNSVGLNRKYQALTKVENKII